MLGKLMKGFGKKDEGPKGLPIVGEAGLGRSVRIDPSMLAAMEEALGEAVSPDLVITGQGLIEMKDEGGASWLHRFYDDEHRMLQALTATVDGAAEEWSFYVPAGAEYPGVGETARDLRARLTKAAFAHDGQPFARAWYGDDPTDQPPVEFTELVYETNELAEGRPLPQACMVYGRDTPQGELLLLAILMGEGPDASLERMLGTGLRPHQIGV